MDRALDSHPEKYEVLKRRGSGFYVQGHMEAEEYLYESTTEIPETPTKEWLRALKGTSKRVKRDGRRVTIKRPQMLYLPLVADTEFQTLPNPDDYPGLHEEILPILQRIDRGSIPLTVQLNTIRESELGPTFLHPAYKQAFPRAEPDLPSPPCPLSRYLTKLCPGSSIEPLDEYSEKWDLYRSLNKNRILRLDLFCHFAVADFYKVWPDGPIRDALLEKSIGDEPLIDQGRRLKCEIDIGKRSGRVQRTRWIRVPAIARINGVGFALEISVVDTAAMAGQAGASLAGFHKCAGVRMTARTTTRGPTRPQ